ncbi:succinate-semialdehyde dehydrogenase domain protein [Mycobacterium xenopi 3993]|nr:succinate-semialdehyde dehydrogenase domain protein [Mycobacterium xenopi 3993]
MQHAHRHHQPGNRRDGPNLYSGHARRNRRSHRAGTCPVRRVSPHYLRAARDVGAATAELLEAEAEKTAAMMTLEMARH